MFKKLFLFLLGLTLGELFTNLRINLASDAVAATHSGTRHAVLEAKGLEKLYSVTINHQNHIYCKKSCKLR